MRVLVCGGRDFHDCGAVWRVLMDLHEAEPISSVIQGGASGADSSAMTWALSEGVPCIEYKADWKSYGRSAGPLRNQLMLSDGKPDLVIAFPGGSGTADMVKRAERAGVRVVSVPGNEGA